MMDFERYAHEVRLAVASVASTFAGIPASFLYESDLQALLFARLFDRLALGNPPQWPLRERDWMVFEDEPPRIVVPVKTEYPSGTWLDIALLAPDFAKTEPRKIWSQPVSVGIEIKLWQADGSGGWQHEDRKKLERLAEEARREGRVFAGACLVFCHRPDDERIEIAAKPGALLVNPVRFELKPGEVVEWVVTSAWHGDETTFTT